MTTNNKTLNASAKGAGLTGACPTGNDLSEDARRTELANLCRALAHPARIALLQAIGQQTCCCHDLCVDLPLAQSTISQHLKILKQAGLVGVRSKAQRNMYYLRAEKLAQFEDIIMPMIGTLQDRARSGAQTST